MRGPLVIASGNAGKIVEIRLALADCGWDLRAQSEFGAPTADEPHSTFFENALAKARAAAAHCKAPAVADDSGLCVESLGGAPGVLSARFSPSGGDDDNNRRLLAAMKKTIGARARRAFYYAAMVFVESADDPAPVFAEGFWRGEILTAPRGDRGFGYDPVFYDPRQKATGAQMTPTQKNRVSHRGRSLRALVAALKKRGVVPRRK